MKRIWTYALLTLGAGSAFALTPLGYEESIAAWRSERVARLTQPQGWLSLVGLHWLESGVHRAGRDADNDIVLATGPAHLGIFSFDGQQVTFEAAPDAEVRLGDVVPSGSVPLPADSSGQVAVLSFDGGEATLQVIERGGRFGLRVRDARAATRSGFVGIEHYPIDPQWRVEARFEPHASGKTIEIANVLGQLQPMKNPGAVVFEHDGRSHRIEAVDEGDGELFLIFADRSNGRETYGAGRFLYAAAPVEGRTVVDFNKAYNPPCAFNAYSTCPLPPPENRLDLAVSAGEKKYAGPTH
jgi:uncharacterized protein (DUF1684 family)